MSILYAKQTVFLSPGAVERVTLPIIPLAAQTDEIVVALKRPTTLTPLAWDETGQVKIRLSVKVDGAETHGAGRVSGGIRKDDKGNEQPYYRLKFSPAYGPRGTGVSKRLGETAKTSYTLQCELILLKGSVETEFEVTATESPAPMFPPRKR
jgi:hypothetical protein